MQDVKLAESDPGLAARWHVGFKLHKYCGWTLLVAAACFSGCQRQARDTRQAGLPSQPIEEPASTVPLGNAVGSTGAGPGGAAGQVPPETAAARVKLEFSEDRNCGVDFVLESGEQGEFTYPEIMCGGVCIADLDGDQDLDLYVPQAGSVPGQEPASTSPRRSLAKASGLFLNDGQGSFRDASTNAGVDHDGYGMGAFAADVDDDNDLDLLLTNVGPVTLLINNGDATFHDATSSSGIPQRGGLWMNAAFGDVNQDQVLDVYIANYTFWSYDTAPQCMGQGGLPDYCDPSNFAGASDMLLLGNGDGTFRDWTEQSGISSAASRSMGVVILDVDHDQDQDIYVACDGEENLLWINNGRGVFVNEAMIRGAALNAAGAAEASMGIACADIDADGDEDLIISHLTNETHTAYRNDDGYFTDVTAATGLAQWSRPDTGFGIGLFDFDNDKWLDLLVANGAVVRPAQPLDPTNPYAQLDRVARGTSRGQFPAAELLTDVQASPEAQVSRGAAFGDLDGDGLVDAVIVVKDGPLRVLKNVTQGDASWIGICPVATSDARGSIGAAVSLPEFPELGTRVVRPHSSYLGSSEDRVRFGLASWDGPVRVVVTWPDGDQEQFASLALRCVHRLVRGGGTAVEPASGLPTARKQQVPLREPDQPLAGVDQQGIAAEGTALPSGSAPSELGPMPPLVLEPVPGKRSLAVKLDQQALQDWCRQAALPPPPQIISLDAPSWKLVHPAIEAAGRSPTIRNLGRLAMLYDGLGVSDSALTLYERVTALEPQQAKWWHLLGRARLYHGDAQLAVQALTKAVALLPEQVAPLARLAEAHLAAGQADESRRLWSQYLNMQPKSELGFTGLARALEALGQRDAALQAAERAIELNRQARSALTIAARLAARAGQTDRAAEYARRAARLDPDNDVALFDEFEHEMLNMAKPANYLLKAAFHFKQQGDFKQAYTLARLAAERRPDEAASWQLLLWLATVLRDGESMLAYAQAAVELDPTFAPAWDTLARQKLAEGNWPAGLELAERALQADGSFGKAHISRGLAQGKLGRYEEALASLERGLTSNPRDIVALQMQASCLIQLDRKQEAGRILQIILALDPKNAWALARAAELR